MVAGRRRAPHEHEVLPTGITECFNVTEAGVPGGQPMLFAHGFGCDQVMWRRVAPAFEDRYRVLLFDHAGSRPNPGEYHPERHSTLGGYAADVVEIMSTEGRRAGELYGHRRLLDLVHAQRDAKPDELAAAVVDDVLRFQDGHAADDVAVVVPRVA